MLLYLQMCFSDFTDGPEIRHEIGKLFIALLCGFLFIHVVIMLARICTTLKLWCKKRHAKRYQQSQVKSTCDSQQV